MKPGIFDPWRQEMPPATKEIQESPLDPDAPPASVTYIRFEGRRSGIYVAVTTPQVSKVSQEEFNAIAVGKVVDAVHAISCLLPGILEGTALSLDDSMTNEYTITLQNGSRKLTVTSSATGSHKTPLAVDAVASTLSGWLSNPKAASILSSAGIRLYNR